jgi:hypothetical protein
MRTFHSLPAAVLLLLCLCITHVASSQARKVPGKRVRPTKDTLVIQFGEIDRLVIPLSSVRQFEVENLNGLIRQLNRDLGQGIDSLGNAGSPVLVLYQETPDDNRQLQVSTKAVERSELYYDRATGAIRKVFSPDSIVVERANRQRLFLILGQLNNLKQLQSQNLDSIIVEVKKAIDTHAQLNGMKNASIPYGGWLQVTYRAQKTDSQNLIDVRTHEDFGLGIILGIGAGLVRSQVVPEIATGIAYRFPRKTAYVGLKFTFHYFFDRRTDGNYGMDINTFMSAELGDKFKSGHSLSIGYLIHRRGDYFKGTTLKFAISSGTPKIGKLRLVPELIVTDNFRVWFPGIRLGVQF